MTRCPICCLLFFLFLSWGMEGQKFRYRTYQGGDVPFQSVEQVLQDSSGYVWIASQQGLFRFDGRFFEDFNLSLKSRHIRHLLSLNKDTLLFTNDTGVFAISNLGRKAKISPFLQKEAFRGLLEYPDQLLMTSKNQLWIGQLNGSVLRWDFKEQKAVRIPIVADKAVHRIYLAEDAFGTLWALIPKTGLFYLKEGLTEFRKFNGFGNKEHFLVEGAQMLLVGENIHQLLLGPEPTNITASQLPLRESGFYKIAKDLGDTYFLASSKGIFTLREEPGQGYQTLTPIYGSNDPHRVRKLPYRQIQALYFTKSQIRPGGNIWIGTGNGLGFLTSSFFQGVPQLPNANIFALANGPNRSVLVSQGDLRSIHKTGNTHLVKELAGLTGVTSISSHGQKIWYGSADGLVFEYKNGLLQRKYDLKDRGSGVFFMAADSQGNNWFCQAPLGKPITGVAKITPEGTLELYGGTKGFESRILTIREGGRSELYAAGIGEKTYLYKYNGTSDVFENKSPPLNFVASENFEVHDLAVNPLGLVWLATTDGLLKYDTEKIQRLDLGAYTTNEIRSVCAMDDGSVWCATDTDGLLHVSSNGNVVRFDEESGTPSKVASYRALMLSGDQVLWFGTAEGLVYSSLSPPRPLLSPIPKIEAALMDGRPISHANDLAINKGKSLQILPFTLDFPSDQTRYQSKLVPWGITKEEAIHFPWNGSSDKTLLVDLLEPGEYELLIRGQRQGGYDWSIPLSKKITVTQPWYISWWGRLILALIGVLLVVGFLRLLGIRDTKKLEHRLTQKEAQLHEQRNKLQHTKEELKTAGANIYLLKRLLAQLPKKGRWKDLLPILQKLVRMPNGLDAFEFAHVQKGDIHYRGYQRNIEKMTQRTGEFNEKLNLASFVLASGKTLFIDDYRERSHTFIEEKDHRGFLSMILVPFQQQNGKEMVFIGYGKTPHAFSKRDLAMMEILTQYLAAIVTDELQ